MNVALFYTEKDYWALGLRILSEILREAGVKTSIFIMSSERPYEQDVLDAAGFLAADADMIGISSMSRGSMKAIQLLQHFRKLEKMTVWGGVHATLNAENCADYADVVCQGEGEEFILDLVRAYEKGQDWRNLPNAAYKSDGRVLLNPCRALFPDLDRLPLPDYSFENEYHLRENKLIRVTDLSDRRRPVVFNASRGCASMCTYCSNTSLRSLSPD